MPSGRQSELLAGVRAELPILVGVVPFGLIYGVLSQAAGLPPLAGQAMSAIVFAGSAQLIGVQLMSVAAPLPVIWLTTLVINLRHVLYSATVSPYLQHLGPAWKWLLAYLLTDEAYAMVATHYLDRSKPPEHKHWFYLGAGLTLWSSWQTSTAFGIFLGAQVPASWSLDFTLALTFIGIVVPTLRTRPALMSAVVAGVVALATAALPYNLFLTLAAICGIATGYVMESRAVKL
jgi:4-azaleucine resistance transporter AzlC